MNIKILSTGGTIGSKFNINSSSVDVADGSDNLCKLLCDYYYKQRPEPEVIFNTESVLNILSENISLENWRQLYEAVIEAQSDMCGGIIITHGTDTLAYTSAFLSFMLNRPNVPIALVSSNAPLDNKKATGYKNFTGAVDFIIKERKKCVFVPTYTNGKTYINLGSRLTQAQPVTHNFKSLGGVYYGIMREDGFHRNNHKYNPDFEEPAINFMPEKINWQNKNIVYIKPFPGLNYNIFNFRENEKPAAILHELYHSGTACAVADMPGHSIIDFAKKYIADGIDFYAAPFDLRYNKYATAGEMQKAGVKFIYNMSVEAAYVKLHIAYGLFKNKKDTANFIEKNIAYEKLF